MLFSRIVRWFVVLTYWFVVHCPVVVSSIHMASHRYCRGSRIWTWNVADNPVSVTYVWVTDTDLKFFPVFHIEIPVPNPVKRVFFQYLWPKRCQNSFTDVASPPWPHYQPKYSWSCCAGPIQRWWNGLTTIWLMLGSGFGVILAKGSQESSQFWVKLQPWIQHGITPMAPLPAKVLLIMLCWTHSEMMKWFDSNMVDVGEWFWGGFGKRQPGIQPCLNLEYSHVWFCWSITSVKMG